jgi:hypothetical protein
MMGVAICIAAVCMGWLAYALATAPYGYEDSGGWHEGIEPCSDYDEPVSGRTGCTAPEARSDHPGAAGDI